MINLLEKQLRGRGRFGKYFRISKTRGVKIVGRGFKSENNVLKSNQILATAQEATFLKIAEQFKITPKVYEVIIAQYKGRFYPAILMEHLIGVPAAQFDDSCLFKVNSQGNISERGVFGATYVKKTLAKAEIIHSDMHYNNMIVSSQNTLKAVDFSPDWVQYTGDQTYFDMICEMLLLKLRNV